MKNHGGAAWPFKARAIRVKARAGPGCDDNHHGFVIRCQHIGFRKGETKILGLWPDIIPLRRLPSGKPWDHIAMRAESQNIRMEKRARGSVIHLMHETGEAIQRHLLEFVRAGNGTLVVASHGTFPQELADCVFQLSGHPIDS